MNKNGFPLCLVFTVEFSESLYFNQISNLVSQRLLLCTPEIVSGPEFTCLFELLRHAYETQPELSIVGIKRTGAFSQNIPINLPE